MIAFYIKISCRLPGNGSQLIFSCTQMIYGLDGSFSPRRRSENRIEQLAMTEYSININYGFLKRLPKVT